MDTLTKVTAPTTSTAASAATTVGARADGQSAGNAFELLMRSMAARFKGTTSALDANIVRDPANRPDVKPVEARDDRRVERDDKGQTKTAEKTDDRKDAQDAKDDAANTDTAKDNAAAAAPASEATQTVQMAALQAQLLSTTTMAPVVEAAQAIVEGPAVDTQIEEVAVATVDPTANVVAQVATVAVQQVATQQVAATEDTGAVVEVTVAADTATQDQTQTEAGPQTAVTTTAAKMQTQTQAADGTQTEEVTEAGEQATDTKQTKSEQSPAAKAQSEAMSRLLGNNDQIKVQVTVEAAKAATPSINPYNIYTGYNANAGASLANGGFGQTPSGNALAADTSAQPQTNTAQPAATTIVAAAVPVTAPAPTVLSAAPVAADTGISAVGASSASHNSAHTQGETGQSGLDHSNTNGANGTDQANGAKGSDGTKQTTPSQVFEQIKVHITRATKAGMDQVTIQLRPDDLGRVEVKLEMAHDGKVKATVIADNAQTLQLMQSDARGLERALTDAGLRTDANSLEFSLRGDGNSGLAKSDSGNAAGGDGSTGEGDVAQDDPSYDYGRAATMRGGVDTYA